MGIGIFEREITEVVWSCRMKETREARALVQKIKLKLDIICPKQSCTSRNIMIYYSIFKRRKHENIHYQDQTFTYRLC